jgi:hypothetical protein
LTVDAIPTLTSIRELAATTTMRVMSRPYLAMSSSVGSDKVIVLAKAQTGSSDAIEYPFANP